MAVNLAEKYSEQVDETIRRGLLSTAGVNNDVTFGNAQTVTVFSMETAPLNDYNPNGGMNRYGTPTELQDATQEMRMSQQKAFTFTIDKTYAADSPESVRNAGKALQRQIERLAALGFGSLPVCIAKTQYSFSDDPARTGAPEGFTVTIKSVKVSAGAGFIVALTGDIMTMPGLPKSPAAERIDVDENGVISGLF